MTKGGWELIQLNQITVKRITEKTKSKPKILRKRKIINIEITSKKAHVKIPDELRKTWTGINQK